MSRYLKTFVILMSLLTFATTSYGAAESVQQVRERLRNGLQSLKQANLNPEQRLKLLIETKTDAEDDMAVLLEKGIASYKDMYKTTSDVAVTIKAINSLNALAMIRLNPQSKLPTVESCEESSAVLSVSNAGPDGEQMMTTGYDQQILAIQKLLCK